ncbi:hypothetical protein QUA74_00945 [Microcoleus sp. LAD1_D3]|uniref:hypothetical protein n=1 Tax=Microcoleus sp. LAD1_D3 TaxID=2819365 RepID=UPI002FD5F576
MIAINHPIGRVASTIQDDQEFLDGTRHVIYPWNQSKIENRKSSSPRIYPWGRL